MYTSSCGESGGGDGVGEEGGGRHGHQHRQSGQQAQKLNVSSVSQLVMNLFKAVSKGY